MKKDKDKKKATEEQDNYTKKLREKDESDRRDKEFTNTITTAIIISSMLD